MTDTYVDEPDIYATPTAFDGLRIVPIEEFAAETEPGRAALAGDADEALIAEDSDVMFYGDGGAGKTTLANDLACHLAAGDDWLGVPIPAPLRVLIVENEGPRPLFRRKLRRKLAGWKGSPLAGRLQVLESPWGAFSFDNELHRDTLARVIEGGTFDVVILGPITRAGMNEAGTLQQVRDFMGLVDQVRKAADRPVAFVLIHHENKGGQVSGAWEGAGDTLFHVQGQGHGRTRLYVQKARWSTSHHAVAFNLLWADGDGFTIEERPEITEETIEAELVAACRAMPGGSWTKIRGQVTGKGTAKDEARDRLIARGTLLNASPVEGRFSLWVFDDPAAPRSRLGTDQERLTFPNLTEGGEADPFPVPAFIGNGENGNGPTDEPHPAENVAAADNTADDEDELERLAEVGREMGLA